MAIEMYYGGRKMKDYKNIERLLKQMNEQLKSLLCDYGLIVVEDALENSVKKSSIHRIFNNIETVEAAISLIGPYLDQCYCIKYDVSSMQDLIKNYGQKERELLERILKYPFWIMNPIFSKEGLCFRNIYFVKISRVDLKEFNFRQVEIEEVHTSITKTEVEEIISIFKEEEKKKVLTYIDELGSYIFLNQIQQINDFKIQADCIVKECMQKIINERVRV